MPIRENQRPPRTPQDWLNKLPQFEPDYSTEYHGIDFETKKALRFPRKRQSALELELTRFFEPHSRSVEWKGKPTGIQRFVENAIRALASFEHRRGRAASFDRKSAQQQLRGAVGKLGTAHTALQEIAANRELSHFLEQIFIASMRTDHRGTNSEPRVTAKTLTAAVRKSDQWLETYHSYSPDALANAIARLEPILSVAAERVEFRSGDIQRDEIAQELCDELAFAWISGTGELPTVSKQNSRSRNKSPFLELLWIINNSLVDQKFKHETDFRNYGFNARKRMKKEFFSG